MGVFGFNQEFASPVDPARLFKAAAIDAHNLFPNLMPLVIKSGAILEGDGGVGSIKQFYFTEAVPFSYVKDRVDVLDEDNFMFKYTLIEGGDLGKKLESSSSYVKFEPSGNGGCICKMGAEYVTYSGVEYTEEDMKLGKDSLMGVYKAVEAHLLAKPEAYA